MKKLIVIVSAVIAFVVASFADGPNCIHWPSFTFGPIAGSTNCSITVTGGQNLVWTGGTWYGFDLLNSSCGYGTPCAYPPMRPYTASINFSLCCSSVETVVGELDWQHWDDDPIEPDWENVNVQVKIPANVSKATVFFYHNQCVGATNCVGVAMQYCVVVTEYCETQGGGGDTD